MLVRALKSAAGPAVDWKSAAVSASSLAGSGAAREAALATAAFIASSAACAALTSLPFAWAVAIRPASAAEIPAKCGLSAITMSAASVSRTWGPISW